MTETTDNIIDRDALQEAYIESIIDGMDHKTICLLYTSPSPRD